ncbi:hypothetical protein NUSPORA_00386 [Nucleospora cyclopteri]
MNVFSLLFNPLPNSLYLKSKDKSIKIGPSSETVYDIQKMIPYESYMPIEAIVFYIAAYNPSKSYVNKIIQNVIEAKKSILSNETYLDFYLNIDDNDTENDIKSILKLRNDIIKEDTSNIFRGLLIKNNNKLKLKRKSFTGINVDLGENRDKMYKEMIYRLRKGITDKDNMVQKIGNEKNEFYRDFLPVEDSERYKLALSLSLGSFVIRLPALFDMIQKINIPKKSLAIRRWISELMSIVQELEMQIERKSLVDQKMITKEFLLGCIQRKNSKFDKIFEVRSEIMDLALFNFSDLIEENIAQEKEIKNMIEVADNITTGKIPIKYNRDITEKYIQYLISTNEKDKNKLLNEFDSFRPKE